MQKIDSKYISAAVVIIVALAKVAGIEIGSDGLTEWITALVTVVGGIIIMIKAKKEGNLTIFGAKRIVDK